MTRAIFNTILQCLVLLLPVLAFAQQKGEVLLTANIKHDPSHKSVDAPTFSISIQNIGNKIILTPKKTILSPYWLSHSFINTTIEEIPLSQDYTEKIKSDSNDVAPFRCNVCFFGPGASDYVNKTAQISPGQAFTVEESILCYNFKRGKKYRIKFSLNSEKISVTGQTEWVYFEIPK